MIANSTATQVVSDEQPKLVLMGNDYTADVIDAMHAKFRLQNGFTWIREHMANAAARQEGTQLMVAVHTREYLPALERIFRATSRFDLEARKDALADQLDRGMLVPGATADAYFAERLLAYEVICDALNYLPVDPSESPTTVLFERIERINRATQP